MPFSVEQHAQLQQKIRFRLATNAVSEWERSFLRDVQAKLDRYGPKTNLTKKQYRLLMKLTGPGAATISSGSNSQVPGKRKPAGRHGPRNRRQESRDLNLKGVLIIVAAICFLVFKAVERFPEYMGPVVSITSIQQVSGPVTRVRDGDTIEVAGVAIRFGSLDCAERGTSEGRRATGRMQELIQGKRLQCFLNGRTSYDRKIGSCQLSDGRDLGGILITEGYCGRFW